MVASFSQSLCQASGLLNIRALVRAKLFDGPPSMAYEAKVNGAPAKPIRGRRLSSSVHTSLIVSRTWGSSSRGSKILRRSISDSDRIGVSKAGPSPLTKSKGSPIGANGKSKSEKRMAASTSSFLSGCRVTSVARSG